MRYQGGKSRIARPIAETIRRMYPDVEEIWEPFCGGGACTLALSKVGFKVHASDIHPDLIMMWRAVMAGDSSVWADVSEEEYASLRRAESSARRGFAGFGASFGGNWWGGFGRGANPNPLKLNVGISSTNSASFTIRSTSSATPTPTHHQMH